MADDPYLTPADLRALVPDLEDDASWPDDRLAELVTEFEALAERYRGVAFTPRSGSVICWSNWHDRPGMFRLDHIEVTEITEVIIDGATMTDPTAGRIVPDRLGDILVAPSTWTTPATGPVEIHYVHGHITPPAAVLRACRLYVRRAGWAEANPNPSNSILRTNLELGISERESTASWKDGRPTGWLDVDGLLNQVRDRRPEGLG